MTNYCHLSYEERKNIEDSLNARKSINQISNELNRFHSTILREIDRNKIYTEPNNWCTSKGFERTPENSQCPRLNKSPYVCNGCKSRSGYRKVRYTYYARKADDYKKLFPIILTDNGHEFFDVNNIECNHKTGELLTKVFYCDPGASWQKGGIEKNHEFIRYVLPKKTTFKNLTQNDCDIIANHINSLCRNSLNKNCPFKAMLFLCDEKVLNTLNMYYIEPDEVRLNHDLLN